jgi:Right handed beta helix region
MRPTLVLVVAALFGLPVHPVSATVYFVSSSGNDTNSGLNANASWRTVSRVNDQVLSAGDQVLFEGGTTFSGSIRVAPPEVGNASQPIVFSSYGKNRATISPASDADGFYARNSGGLIVSNLNFAGRGRTASIGCGIEFYNNVAGTTLNFFRVDHVDVRDFGRVGVEFRGSGATTRIRDVQVTYANIHDIGLCGIKTSASGINVHSNIYVGFCTVSNVAGVTTAASHTGDGILIAQAANALVEYCIAVGNCWNGNGAVGIWTFASTGVTIQFCESYGNGTSGTDDGDGFDLDGGSTDCVMQYNYSHDNAGAGFGIFQFSWAPYYANNIVRYNISQNDGRKNSYGAITIWNNKNGGGINNVEIYNNTLLMTPAISGSPSGIKLFGTSELTNVNIRNNCMITTRGLPLVKSMLASLTGINFQGNDYWSSGGTFSIQCNKSTNYGSLAAWRGAGMEKLGVMEVGINLDPQLVNPGVGGTLGDAMLLPELLPKLTDYQTKPFSPLREAGLDLNARFGLNIGAHDFYGNKVPNGLPDIGAYDGQPVQTQTQRILPAGR